MKDYTDVSTVAPPPPRTAHLVRLSDVQPEPVDWLWQPYLPRRKLTFLEGDPAGGKTWLALEVAAAVTRGWGLPDSTGRPVGQCGPFDVIYLTGEDGLADTLRPRLDALAADSTRVLALTGASDGEQIGAVTLQDIDVLEDALRRTGAALVIVDPIQAFLGGNIDMHRANEVRPVLTRLARCADEHGCAILCIRHLSKANSTHALYRGLGSIDFSAAARSVLLVGRDPNDPNKRAMVQIKNSLAAEGPALAYVINGDCFEWAGLSTLTAGALLASGASADDRSALDDAKSFLETVLSDGSVPAKDIQRQARDAGISERTLNRAKVELGVKSHHSTNRWVWGLSRLPTLPNSELGNLGNVDGQGFETGLI